MLRLTWESVGQCDSYTTYKNLLRYKVVQLDTEHLQWPNIKFLKNIYIYNKSNKITVALQPITSSHPQKKWNTGAFGAPSSDSRHCVQVRPHPLPVRLSQTVADGRLRVQDPPPEAIAVSRQLLPVAFTGRLAGEGPRPHDMDLDDRRKLHLFLPAARLVLLPVRT